jgi:ribonucleoside-diphosphate reductase alpha chain
MVEDSRIRKYKYEGGARGFLQTTAELLFESGYPYILFEDNANRAHANDKLGRINMSNLCTEILQANSESVFNEDLSYDTLGRDISCNLASLNIAKAMEGGNLGRTVRTAIRALSAVSDLSEINSVPSVREGNNKSRAIGLGQMNLHGFFIKHGWKYGSPESLDFTNAYFMTVAYHAYAASHLLAKETGSPFDGFEKSKYADASYLTEKYADPAMIEVTRETAQLFADYGVTIPKAEDWAHLAQEIAKHGLYNAYLQAIPPTGSISYVNYSTSSIHPVAQAVETRKEGLTGRVYFPQPYVTNENFADVEDAYQVGPERTIDVYAEATKHVDQGLSLTLFFPDTATTRDINKAQMYAWKRGIKTLYYSRVRQADLAGTELEGCVSCAL